MPDGEPVPGLRHGARPVHQRLRARVRQRRAQSNGDGPRRSGLARSRARGSADVGDAGRGVRAVPLRQRRSLGLRPAPEAAALRRFPVGARPGAESSSRRRRRATRMSHYNFAYLDEQTKRMIRRAILKAVAIPGYQVPFGSREMPLSYGWGTGGIQVTASVIGPGDVLKVIDQGADDTTNAVSIRRFFEKTTGVRTTTRTEDATLIQTRHRIPETPLGPGQILVLQVPIPEPLRWLELREAETRKMHALEEYGVMYVRLYEDITRHGKVAQTYEYPVIV